MKEYIEKWDALMQLTGINLPEDTCSYMGIVDRRIYNLPPANVVEREKIDKAIDEIEHARLANHNFDDRFIYSKCLEIIKRNIGE